MSNSEEKRITIILTTSPSPTNPDTCVIDPTLRSLHLIKGLNKCKIIITLDGYKVWNCNEYKKGRLTQDKIIQYEQYKKNVKMLIQKEWEGESILLHMPHRIGFAMAILEALAYVTTPFVFIIQHDWQFIKPISCLSNLLNTMEKNVQNIRYIGFSSSSSTDYKKRLGDNSRIKVETEEYDNIPLIKLLFWYDKNHICRTDTYLAILPGLHKGNFIEDTVGQQQWKEIKKEGIQAHSRYGTYLYYPEGGKDVYLYHSNGRRRDNGISMHTCPVGWSTDQECTFTYFRSIFNDEKEEKEENEDFKGIDEEKICETPLISKLSADSRPQHQTIYATSKGVCPYFLRGYCKFDSQSCARSHHSYTRSALFTSSITSITSSSSSSLSEITDWSLHVAVQQ